jgi:hypothetical protein
MKLRLRSIFLLAIVSLFVSCQKKEVVYQFDGSNTAYFQEWLLCGPFPNCTDCDPVDYMHDEKCKGFFIDYLATIGGEASAVPLRGTKVVGDDQTFKWFYHNAETDKIPFNSIFEPNDMVIAYAFCQVNSTTEQKAILSVGSNDGVRVFLNGQQVHQAHPAFGRWLQPDNDYVPVKLNQGLNNLMFKVDDGLGDFGLVVRLLNYDSTMTAIREKLDDHTALSIVSEKDKLVTQFGQPFKISALAPGVEATTEILNSRGRKIASKKGLPGFPIEFDLNDVPNGFMLARTTLETESDGQIVTEKRHFKGKLKRHPRAKMLNRDLMPMDENGKGFLPIGTYGAPEDEYGQLKKAGYNYVVASVSQLDKVHEAGLKAAVHVHGHKPHWFTSVRDTIKKYKDHPAVLCWMLYDEPGYNRADLLDIYKLYNVAYEADPYHPSYLVITTNKVYETFGRCSDVLSIDTYPIAQGNILAVGDNIKLALATSDGDQPIWHCGQMFHWPAQRYPTPQEHRFMTYSAMMRGAKGLLWYTYKGYGQYLPEEAPELWAAQKELLAELHDMEDFWMTRGYGKMIADGEEAQVLASMKKSPIGTFVIAVNTSKTESITQELVLPGVKNGTLTVYNEDRSLSISDGSFKDDFAPLDVHIYKIE